MHGGDWLKHLALGGVALALLGACAGPLEPLPEGASEATKCGYVEADEAAQKAQEDYTRAKESGAVRAKQFERANEAAQQRRDDAKRCEDRAREWADLLAQQQSARAAVSSAQTAQAAIIWTLGEIAALIVTIAVGIYAIVITKRASDAQIRTMKDEGTATANRFKEELGVAKRAADDARKIGEAQVRCYLTIAEIQMAFGGDERTDLTFAAGGEPYREHKWMPKVFLKIENGGQSPALNVHWVPSIKYIAHDFEQNRHTVRQGPRHFPLPDELKTRRWNQSIAATRPLSTSADVHFFLNDEEVRALERPNGIGGLGVTLVISLCWRDVFDNVFYEDYAFASGMGGARPGDRFPVDAQVPLSQFDADVPILLSYRRPKQKEDKKEPHGDGS